MKFLFAATAVLFITPVLAKAADTAATTAAVRKPASSLANCTHKMPKLALCDLNFSGYGVTKKQAVKIALAAQANPDPSMLPTDTSGKAKIDLQHVNIDTDPNNGYAFITVSTQQETHGNSEKCPEQTTASADFNYGECHAGGFNFKYDSDECKVTMKCKIE